MRRTGLRSHVVTLAVSRFVPYRDLVSDSSDRPRSRTSVRRNRLGTAWARVVAAGWVGITLGLASIGASSQVIGRPVWWADDVRWGTVGVVAMVFAVFALCTGIVVWCFIGGSWIPQVSTLGGLLLAIAAFADRDASPGGAIVTGALAAAAILLGVGALSGLSSGLVQRNDAASDSTTAV